MAWQWSFSSESESEIYNILHSQPKEFLIGALLEWDYYFDNNANLDELKEKYEKLPNDIIADSVWEMMSSEDHGRTCSNGGYEIYCDKEGYYSFNW